MSEQRYKHEVASLRSPERIKQLEVERVVELILASLPAQTMLDVGCGSGVFAEAFATRGLEVAGVDVERDMLAVARQHVPQAQFREAPAESLPYAADSFDMVFMGNVLHETDDAVAALEEARRVALQGVAILEWPYVDEEPGPPLARRLRPEDVATLAEQVGFAAGQAVSLKHRILYIYRVLPPIETTYE